MIARAKLLLFALLATTATCATGSAMSSPSLEPAVQAKAPPGASRHRLAASSLPNLCEVAEGRWCVPCGGPGEPACPEGDSGALCCAGGYCVEWTGGDCDGDLGWCENYTTSTGPGGITEATCWD